MTATPFPYPIGINNLMDLISYTNSLVSGTLGIGLLIIIGMVSFLSTKTYSYEKAMGFSGFLVLLSSIILRFANLINDATLIVCIALFVGSLILLFREREIETGG